MVAARAGRDGYVRQIAGYKTGEDDTRARYVSWAIFEILWGTALNRDTDEEEPLTRARMSMCHVCVSITSDKKNISKSQGICGEILACMSWECIRFQVDVIAGDGNKACYLATPKVGGCPSYEVS